jgi:N-carbamoyl-L-amino-acid hydrolase
MNAQRVISDLRDLAARTSTPDGAQRLAWGPVWREAREWFTGRVAELGLRVEADSAGNNWVTLPGASPKTVIVGSHLDSVPNGGWLDGCLGMMAGLEALRMHAATPPPVTLKLVDWADEEGARFGRSLLGSAAAAGSLKIESVRELTDRQGTRLVDALAENGVARPDADAHRAEGDRCRRVSRAARAGPVLVARSRPVGWAFGVDATCSASSACRAGRRDSIGDAFLARRDRLAARDRDPPFEAGAARRQRRLHRRHRPSSRIVTVPGVCEISLDQRASKEVLAAMLSDARAVPRAAGENRVAVECASCGASSHVRSMRRWWLCGSRAEEWRGRACLGPAARRGRDGAAHARGDDVRICRTPRTARRTRRPPTRDLDPPTCGWSKPLPTSPRGEGGYNSHHARPAGR